ncbi:MAG: cytochrome b/b6 domain-containing protein [Halanaeroarchaeum sp.]
MSDAASVSRFSSVQVYVHFLMALSILVLLFTGLGITFEDHVWWIAALLGYGNVVLVHVASGVLLLGTLIYYVIYALTGLLTGDFPTAWIPGRDTIDEIVAYARFALGRGEKPDAGKYTWVQKSEMLIISLETTVLVVTGLLLTFPGLLLQYKPAYLPVSDVHTVVAYTLLMGVSFHLFDRHVERFPLDESIFTGRVSVARAREEWADWVAGETPKEAEQKPGEAREREQTEEAAPERPPDHASTPLRLGGLAVLFFLFLVVTSGVLIDRVLAPLPTTDATLYFRYSAEDVLTGTFGPFWTVGLNLVALVVLAGLVALLYGLSLRLTTSTR